MYRADHQPVLRCRRCNKPFDKESTLKRHEYYCRSRKAGSAAPTRPRSCVACARAKTGCDNRRPQCSRCRTKSIACHYPANPPRDTGPRSPHSEDSPAAQLTAPPSSPARSPGVGKDPAASSDADMILDGALVLPDADFASLGEDYLGWAEVDNGLADFLNVPTDAPYFLSDLSPPVLSIPRTPSCAVRSLVQRPRRQPGAQRVANLILHTLKSYPHMMLRHDTLPPFIHSSLVSSDADDVSMEPLTNCISVVRMISGGGRAGRKLFWKNVRMECDRLVAEHTQLGSWEVLAAMQAVTIYVLIRLDEGETDDNNLDALLVKAVTLLAQDIGRNGQTCNAQCTLCNKGLGTSWKEWLFRESRRRLAVVYRVINMLVFFEPATMCDLPADLIIAPLPAKRQLWEAGDEFAWKVASQREPLGVETALGLAANGDIVRIDDGQLSCGDAWLGGRSLGAAPQTTASWEEWCAGMDGFGGIVMLAASLIV